MSEMDLADLPLALLLAWMLETPAPHPPHEGIEFIQCPSGGESPQAFRAQPRLGNDRAEWRLANEQGERSVAQDVGPTHSTTLIRVHPSAIHEQWCAVVAPGCLDFLIIVARHLLQILELHLQLWGQPCWIKAVEIPRVNACGDERMG